MKSGCGRRSAPAGRACSRGIFSRAFVLVGSGVAAGNLVLMLIIVRSRTRWISADVPAALLTTSAVMLSVGLLACVEPARRALRIQPTDALKEA